MTAHRFVLAGIFAGVALTIAATQVEGGNERISIKLLVPADAQVEIDGNNTKSTGESRTYVTPPLSPAKDYSYNIKVTSKGKVVTRTIKIRQGGDNTFDLRPDFQGAAVASLTEEEALKLGAEAYIYGYPLVTMELTRRVMTNFEAPTQTGAPMGQLMRLRAYPTPEDRQVTAPNADTLYSVAWLDVAKEPWVLSQPDFKDRYYLMPMLDGWSDVFQDTGTRTTGNAAQK